MQACYTNADYYAEKYCGPTEYGYGLLLEFSSIWIIHDVLLMSNPHQIWVYYE